MTLLLANWRYAVMAVLLAFGVLQTIRLDGAKADVRALRAEVAQFQAAYDALTASVQRQNQAVNDWQSKAEQAAQAGRRARAEAVRVVAEHRRSADALAAAVANARGPPGEPLTCETGLGVVRADLAGH